MPNRSTKVTDQVSLKIIYIISIVIKNHYKKNDYLNEVFFCFVIVWMLLSLTIQE